MIGGLKRPYPAMKDSGVPWLGEVPEHWEVRKLKYAVSFSGGGTPSKADASFWGGHIPWVSPKDMTRARITDSIDHITEEALSSSAASIVPPGALLIVVRSGILRRTIPVAINAAEVALNQDMKALRPRDGVVASKYLRALVQGNEGALIQEWTKQGATVESIEHEFLANSLIPLPPLPEQAAIVRFLDHADRRIRRYIRAKQKLIKLLEEQKQAIIHRAVTRGLDPNVRLKPSGVEWLGDVPEHWEVVPLKRIGSVRIGLTYSPGDVCDESGTLVLRASNIRSGKLVHADDVHVSRVVPTNLRVKESDILVCVRSGSRNLVGKSALIPKEFEGVSYGAFMSLLKTVDNRFYYRVLNSNLLPTVMAQFETSTINQLTQNDLRCLVVPVPPETERAEITAFLDAETGNADGAMAAAAAEIKLLREYRTRLIADVVTGKLDVREAAARLPEEGDEPDLFDVAEAESDTDEPADDLDAAAEEAAT